MLLYKMDKSVGHSLFENTLIKCSATVVESIYDKNVRYGSERGCEYWAMSLTESRVKLFEILLGFLAKNGLIS